MSRPLRSIPRAQNRLADLMDAHLARGGLIIAATHGPLGLDRAANSNWVRHERALIRRRA